LPKIPVRVAHALRAKASECPCRIAEVQGYTTPAVRDVGGASLRLRFEGHPPEAGGYILAVRPRLHHHDQNEINHWIPAIAGIPGDVGKDRYGQSRVSLGELMLLARAVAAGEGRLRSCCLDEVDHVTFLPTEVLEQHYPIGLELEVSFVERATDFFLGLNAGRWLAIRMDQIASAANLALCGEEQHNIRYLDFMKGTHFEATMSNLVTPPPEDATHLFDGLSSNAGVSGQVIIH